MLSRDGAHFFSNNLTSDDTLFSDKLQFIDHSCQPEHGHTYYCAHLSLRIYIMLSLRLS